jgi:hypothetical protein
MGPARIYPWRKMHRFRAPSIAPGTFFAAQFSAGYTTNMSGFDLRQAQLSFSKTVMDITHRSTRPLYALLTSSKG